MADRRPIEQTLAQVGRPELLTVQGASPAKINVDSLSFFYGRNQALKDVAFDIPERKITAIIGPSGCGKTTLLRVFNRMYDLVPGAHAEGAGAGIAEVELQPGERFDVRVLCSQRKREERANDGRENESAHVSSSEIGFVEG